jgi:hypothetical protein
MMAMFLMSCILRLFYSFKKSRKDTFFSRKRQLMHRSGETDNFFHFGLPGISRADFLPRRRPFFAKKCKLSVWLPPKIGLRRACRAENAIKRFIIRYTDNFSQLCKK